MAPPDVAVETKNRLFVSYSRRDADFVRKLCAGLLEQSIDSWVDWEDIPPSAEWMAEIQRGIDAADAFAFVISDNSVASTVCGEELGYATAAGKRLIPLLLTHVGHERVPESVRRLNWIDATDPAGLPDVVRRLVEALTTDLPLLRMHARLLVRAREWLASGRDPSFLLRGVDLEEALQWLGAVTEAGPLPSPEHNEYLQASQHEQQAEVERWRGLYRHALARQLAAQSELLRGERPEDLELAVLLASESLRIESSPEAVAAMSRGLALLPRRGRIDLRLGDEAWVSDLVHSADGRWLFAACQDGRVRVVDVARGVVAQQLSGGAQLETLAVSGDAGWVACSEFQSPLVRLWCRPDEDMQHTLEVAAPVTAIAMSPDGDLMAVGCADGVVAIHQPGEPDPVRRLAHGGPVSGLAFFAGPAVLVTGGEDGRTRLWSVSDGSLRWEHDHGAAVTDVAASPDGRRIASAAYDGRVTLFRAKSGRVVGQVTHDEPVEGVRFSPDSRLVAAHGSFDADVLLIDAAHAVALARFDPASGCHGLAFDRTSRRLATTGLSTVVQVWDVAARTEIARLVAETGIWAVEFAPDSGELRVGDANGRVRSVDLGDGRTLRHGERLESAVLSPDGSVVAMARGDGDVVIGAFGDALDARVTAGADIGRMDVDNHGQRLVAHRPSLGNIDVWDASLDRLLWRAKPLRSGDAAPDFRLGSLSPDAVFVALETEQGHDLDLADASAGARLLTATHDDVAAHGDFSPDSRLWATCAEDVLKVWDIETRSLRFDVVHGGYVTAARFSPDGRWVVSGSYDGLVRVLDAASGEVVSELAHGGPVSAVAVAAQGDWLAAAGEKSLTLWRFADRELVHRAATDFGVENIVFTHDGRHVAGGSRGERARFWRVEDARAHRAGVGDVPR